MIDVGHYSFTNQDARNTFRSLGGIMSGLLAQGSSEAVHPAAAELRGYFSAELGSDVSGLDLQAALDTLGHEAHRRFGLENWTPKDAPRHLGALMRGVSAAMAALRQANTVPASHGVVAQLSSSLGGVPKAARDHVDVTYQGVRGDVQGTRQHHGRPWQALCIWSSEVIEQLRAEGHDMAPGHAGENITVSGLDWNAVRPGAMLRCGPVVAEVWAYADPCSNLKRWFRDGDITRLHWRNGDLSRVYALVRATGRIAQGDTISVDSAGRAARA